MASSSKSEVLQDSLINVPYSITLNEDITQEIEEDPRLLNQLMKLSEEIQKKHFRLNFSIGINIVLLIVLIAIMIIKL